MSKSAFEKMTGIGSGLLLLLGMLLVGLFLSQGCAEVAGKIAGSGTRQTLLAGGICQNILAFIMPAVLTLMFLRIRPDRGMGLGKEPRWPVLLIIMLVYVVSLPGLDLVIYWNEHIPLEGSLKGLGDKIREMEELNGGVLKAMLTTGSVGGLIVNILTVGILTGLSEEIFFRGGMQRIMTGYGVNHHVAVWTCAFIFSFMHFEFFGFFPRLLLGAWFGYLFYWTGTVWTSAFAHALNNSLAVLSYWTMQKEGNVIDYDSLGSSLAGFPWISIISIAVTAAVIYVIYMWRKGTATQCQPSGDHTLNNIDRG